MLTRELFAVLWNRTIDECTIGVTSSSWPLYRFIGAVTRAQIAYNLTNPLILKVPLATWCAR
jgi:hypothetical protein